MTDSANLADRETRSFTASGKFLVLEFRHNPFFRIAFQAIGVELRLISVVFGPKIASPREMIEAGTLVPRQSLGVVVRVRQGV